MTALGIPLFTEFKGQYARRDCGQFVFIKLHFRDISSWDILLSTLFGRSITVYSSNITAKKEIFPLYETFKKEYRVPTAYLNNIRNDPQFKIYMTPAEQEEYLAKWEECQS
jgi:hypothetical protein